MPRRHGRETLVFVDGYDVSGDSTNAVVDMVADAPEVSGFGARKFYTIGQVAGRIAHSGWFNKTSPDGLHTLMAAKVGTTAHVAVAWGTAVGDYGYAGSAPIVANYVPTTPLAGAVATQGEYQQSGKFDFTQTLWPKSNLTTTGSAKDDLEGTNNGIRGYLHIGSVLGGTPVVTVEHSTTGTSAWATLLTYTGATAPQAQAVEATGTVRQYLRTNVSGGSALAFLSYSRLQ